MAKFYNTEITLGQTKNGVTFVSLSGADAASIAYNRISPLNQPLSSESVNVQFANSTTPAVSGDLVINTVYASVSAVFEVIVGEDSFEFTFVPSLTGYDPADVVEVADSDDHWGPEKIRRKLLGYI